MTAVEAGRVAGQKPTHDIGYRHHACSEKQVEMVGNQSPSIARSLRLRQNPREPFQEIISIPIIGEYLPSADPPSDHVLKCIGCIYS